MNRWEVVDRAGRSVYITRERWEHIIDKHVELDSRLDDVLTTIRDGRRRQTKRDPQTYIYYRRYNDLPEPYDTILVFVAFRYQQNNGTILSNNFVTTAWGDVSQA